MDANQSSLSRKQLIFAELLAGTLIYVAVLGLFDDYTDIVTAKSFSTIVFASILLEALTFLTFLFKDWWIGFLTRWRGELSRPQKLFGLWLVMFFSKFVFLWAIEFVFQDAFEVKRQDRTSTRRQLSAKPQLCPTSCRRLRYSSQQITLLTMSR